MPSHTYCINLGPNRLRLGDVNDRPQKCKMGTETKVSGEPESTISGGNEAVEAKAVPPTTPGAQHCAPATTRGSASVSRSQQAKRDILTNRRNDREPQNRTNSPNSSFQFADNTSPQFNERPTTVPRLVSVNLTEPPSNIVPAHLKGDTPREVNLIKESHSSIGIKQEATKTTKVAPTESYQDYAERVSLRGASAESEDPESHMLPFDDSSKMASSRDPDIIPKQEILRDLATYSETQKSTNVGSNESQRPGMFSERSSKSIKSFQGLTAELVDPVEERTRVEKELLNDAAVAEVVEEKTPAKKLWRYCAIVILTTVIVAALVIVVSIFTVHSSKASIAPTMQPTLPPEVRITQLVQFLNDITMSKDTIVYPYKNTSTVESKSLEWMIDEDPLRLTVEDGDRFLQRFVLVCLFMGSPDNELSDDWLQEESECSWSGVNCNDDGTVIGVALPGKKLEKLPDDLGLLNSLHSLDFTDNFLVGTIPSSLSLMTDLSVFSVKDNILSGTIPWDTLSTIVDLEVIDLSINYFSGSLPSLVGKWWPNLTIFSIFLNNVTGEIPNDLVSWSLLTEFHIDDTLISGSIPSSIGT